jgi:predicted ArsR family transcriptional regulator
LSIYFDKIFEKIELFLRFSDNRGMKGMTIDEIAEALKISPKTAHKRLERAGIKPVSYKALYDPSVVENIRVVDKGGRPKKAKPEPKPE